jgi:phosphinothricin acetyltransferase
VSPEDEVSERLGASTIRIASSTDLPAIVEIYNDAVAQRFATADLAAVTPSSRRVWFDDHDPADFPIWVLEQDGRVRGWCSLSAYRARRAALLGTAEISYYVARDAQRRGLGTALVRHAIVEAPRHGKRVLFGILLERNIASVRLLTNCGFELWGRLPDVALIDGELVSHVYYGRKV